MTAYSRVRGRGKWGDGGIRSLSMHDVCLFVSFISIPNDSKFVSGISKGIFVYVFVCMYVHI